MWKVSDRFGLAVTQSHRIATRVDVWQNGELAYEDVRVAGGSVSVDGSSQIRRTCEMELSLPQLPTSLLAPGMPNGSEVAVYRGIHFTDEEVEWVPLGVFRVDTVRLSRPGQKFQLRGSDRGIMLQDDRFLSPTNSRGETVKGELAFIVNDSVDGLEVVDNTTKDLAMWPVTWDRERWEAIDKLTDSIGAVAYFDPSGRFTISPLPTIDTDPVFKISTGVNMVTSSVEITRLDTYNAVVVSGEQIDAESAVVHVVVKDDDPTSPTFWDGPFGHRPKFYSSQFIKDEANAIEVGQGMLGKYAGLPRTLDLSAVPHPGLDAGDVIEVEFPGSRERHVIDSLTIGLGADAPMTARTRTVSKVVEG
jgi:hypothetical protein